MISESDFVTASDRVLAAIGGAIDKALEDGDADLDWTLQDGILEIECADGSKLIVNRHVPNREIWVAARSGGFHFAPTGQGWRDTRSGEDLAEALTRLLQSQGGIEVALSL